VRHDCGRLGTEGLVGDENDDERRGEKVLRDARPARPRLARPEVLEALLLPGDYGLRLDDHERVDPARDLVFEHRPKHPVERIDVRPGVLALEDGELLA